MAYFAAVKITDIHGNVVELTDTTELLTNILLELKAIHVILEESTEKKFKTEELNGN